MSIASTTIAATLKPSGTSDEPSPRARGLRRLIAATSDRPDLLNGSLSLVNQAVVSGTSFVTSVIIGRMCSKEDLGIFYLALTMIYLARGIQEQLVSAPYVVYCHGRPNEAQARYSGSVLLHQFGLTAAGLLVLLGILGLLSLGFGQQSLAPAVWVLLGALPFLQLREFIRRLAIAHLEMGTAILIDGAVAIFQIGSLVALAYFERLTVPVAYAVMGAACAVACAGWFVARRRPLAFTWSGAVSDWFHNWGFARWALASHLVGFGTPYLMPWLVTAISGSADAGVLAACVSLVGTASMFVSGLAAYLIPRASLAFTRGGIDELRRVLRVANLVLGSVLGSFALLVILSGDFLLVFAFGDKYAGNGPTLAVLALGMVAMGLGLTPGVGLWAIDRPKSNLLGDVCTLVVTVVLVVCLVQPLGVLGAALGDLAGKLVGALIRQATFRRLAKTAVPVGGA